MPIQKDKRSGKFEQADETTKALDMAESGECSYYRAAIIMGLSMSTIYRAKARRKQAREAGEA